MAENLSLRTIPQPYGENYLTRVVGVETREGPVIWTPSRLAGRPTSYYDKREAEEVIFTVDQVFSSRFLSFFSRFMLDSPPKIGDHSLNNFNCHRFALWMNGTIFPSTKFGRGEAKSIMDNGDLQPKGTTLPLGKHAVLGAIHEGEGVAYPFHSVIGLGEGQNSCIQVMNTAGYMGIKTYEGVLESYDQSSNTWQDCGMYVEPRLDPGLSEEVTEHHTALATAT